MVTGNCITIQHGGFRLQLPYGLDGIRETTAAMRTERDNSFIAEVVFIKERVEWHRHIVPPVGESNEDHIVVIEIFDVCSQLRTGIVVYLDLCRIDQCLMRAGIGVYGLYLEKVAARSFTDDGAMYCVFPITLPLETRRLAPEEASTPSVSGNGEINHQSFSFSFER